MKKLIISIALVSISLFSCSKKEEVKPQTKSEIESQNIKKQITDLEKRKADLEKKMVDYRMRMGGTTSQTQIQTINNYQRQIADLDKQINELYRKLTLLNS